MYPSTIIGHPSEPYMSADPNFVAQYRVVSEAVLGSG